MIYFLYMYGRAHNCITLTSIVRILHISYIFWSKIRWFNLCMYTFGRSAVDQLANRLTPHILAGTRQPKRAQFPRSWDGTRHIPANVKCSTRNSVYMCMRWGGGVASIVREGGSTFLPHTPLLRLPSSFLRLPEESFLYHGSDARFC